MLYDGLNKVCCRVMPSHLDDRIVSADTTYVGLVHKYDDPRFLYEWSAGYWS